VTRDAACTILHINRPNYKNNNGKIKMVMYVNQQMGSESKAIIKHNQDNRAGTMAAHPKKWKKELV
jgi:hypothetical protein